MSRRNTDTTHMLIVGFALIVLAVVIVRYGPQLAQSWGL